MDETNCCAGEKDMILILLAGQSNMAGRGLITPEDLEVPENVFYLSDDLVWRPAVEPIHRDRPFVGQPDTGCGAVGGDEFDALAETGGGRIVGVGLGRTFGIELSKRFPGRRIGLIPAAVGGTPLSCWKPGAEDRLDKNRHPYDDMLKKAREAMKYGHIAAVLWHQGESDAQFSNMDYKKDLLEVVGNFRRELELGDIPFIFGELAGFYDRPGIVENAPFIGRMIAEVAAELPLTGLVSVAGLNHKGDHLHFDAESCRILGRRYFDEFCRLSALHPEAPWSRGWR